MAQKVLHRKIITNQEVYEMLGQGEQDGIWKEYLTQSGLTLAPGESIGKVIQELQVVCESLSKVELLALANNLPVTEQEVASIIGAHDQAKYIADLIQRHKKAPVAIMMRESSASRKK